MEASCDILLITFWNTGLWRNWLAHWTVAPGVAGSSPVDPASTEGQTRLPRGVMVAPQILILLVGVRVPATQPLNFPLMLNRYLALYCQFATFLSPTKSADGHGRVRPCAKEELFQIKRVNV